MALQTLIGIYDATRPALCRTRRNRHALLSHQGIVATMRIRRRLTSLDKHKPSTHDLILDHYRELWGPDRVEEVHWTPDHVASRLPDLHIAKIRPATPDDMWTFATIGAWRGTEREKSGLEFVAVSRGLSAAVMQRLAMTAHYHAGPPENRLGAGHLLPIGDGWVKGSTLDAILVSLPHLWGPKLEHCQLPDRHIQVLWVLPISSAERLFAREHSVEALEQQFEDTGLNYLDPFRASVVEGDPPRSARGRSQLKILWSAEPTEKHWASCPSAPSVARGYAAERRL